ncbi:MAG: hypothetical protein HND48_01960 [Chloroflexi bacterium]|nr:hypothetical protein [Chloroflexota bacterium]
MTANDASHWGVFGHDWAVDYLRKGLRHAARVRRISSPVRRDRQNDAGACLAAALNCQHPDVDARPCGECRSCRVIASGNHPDILYAEEDDSSGTLKIEALRDLMRRLALKPYDARYRVAIVPGFERARGPAQDAILKTWKNRRRMRF